MRAHHGARNPLEWDDPKGRPSGILSEQYNHLRAKSPPARVHEQYFIFNNPLMK